MNSAVSNRFNKLDFHDDALTFIEIHPPVKIAQNHTRIEFGFLDDSTGRKKTLSFHDCANIRFIMDFDVLADGCIFGTKGSLARIDIARMRRFIRSQMSHWRVQYMPPTPKDKPIRKKMKTIRNYVLFRITFFGGTAEILAKSFQLRS